jgi:predicted lipid carrier protein YhbT
MNDNPSETPRHPRLPAPLAFPLGLVPERVHGTLLAGILNRVFAPELAGGELDFLEGRTVLIQVTDARLRFRLAAAGGRLVPSGDPEDLAIRGSAYDFLLLATRREDPDTLFFNRRLQLGGDTELGLHVKNFLDALELEGRVGPLLKMLEGTTWAAERLAGAHRA